MAKGTPQRGETPKIQQHYAGVRRRRLCKLVCTSHECAWGRHAHAHLQHLHPHSCMPMLMSVRCRDVLRSTCTRAQHAGPHPCVYRCTNAVRSLEALVATCAWRRVWDQGGSKPRVCKPVPSRSRCRSRWRCASGLKGWRRCAAAVRVRPKRRRRRAAALRVRVRLKGRRR